MKNFQHNTVKTFAELLAASGLRAPSELRPWHILRRVSPTEVRHYGEMYEYLKDRELLAEPVPRASRALGAPRALRPSTLP